MVAGPVAVLALLALLWPGSSGNNDESSEPELVLSDAAAPAETRPLLRLPRKPRPHRPIQSNQGLLKSWAVFISTKINQISTRKVFKRWNISLADFVRVISATNRPFSSLGLPVQKEQPITIPSLPMHEQRRWQVVLMKKDLRMFPIQAVLKLVGLKRIQIPKTHVITAVQKFT